MTKKTVIKIGEIYGVRTLFGIYNIKVVNITPKTLTYEPTISPELLGKKTIRMNKYGEWNIQLTTPFTREEIKESVRKDREEAKYR